MRVIRSGTVTRAIRRLAVVGAGAALAAGLLAAPASVGQASVSRDRAGRAPSPAKASAESRALARIIAAQRARLGRGTRTAEPAAGVITGLVKGIGGSPFAGACLTATSPGRSVTAASRSDGRYVLAGLRPGRYTLRIGGCPGDGMPGSRTPISVLWPHPPAVVTVVAGQVMTLPPATAWLGWYGLTGDRAAAQRVASGTKTGGISGRVTGHGRPLAHICAVAVRSVLYQGGPEPHAITSKSGRYRIGGLRPGQYQVVFRTGLRSCASDANWLPQWYPYLDSAYPPDKAANVRVRAGRDTGQIDGRLNLGGEISGTVRTRSGDTVRGICVSFYSEFSAVINGLYVVNVAAVSGRTGRYALRGLFGGSYQIQFAIGCGSRGDYAQQWWRDKASPDHANTIKLARRQIVTGVDAGLLPGAAITGTVRAKTASEKPLAGVCVSASPEAVFGSYADAVTAKNGSYLLEGLNTGRYQVSFDPSCSGFVAAGYLPAQRLVTASDGHTRSGIDAFLRPAAGISGVVRDFAGKPVSACVTVLDRHNDFSITSANGRYSITGVVPGKYAVEFEDCGNSGSLAPQWYDNRPNSGSADLVTFAAGKIDRISAMLHPGGTLAGFLTTAGGRPISGQCVAALSQDGSFAESGGAGDNTMSADNGRYVIGDLPPGLYQVSFNCGLGRYASEWFRSQPDATTADYVAIDPRVTTTVNETLARAGIIKGKVTDKAGRPIPDICVNVANARNGQLIPPIDSGAMTDHGRYQVGQLAPGRYLVQFTDCNGDVYGTEWYRGKNSESFATPVTVRPGHATTGIDGVLTVGGTISGRVSGPGGKPALNTCVFAFDPASMSFEGLAFTGGDGRYKVTGLSSGRYHLSFSDCGSQNLASITLPAPVRVVAPHAVAGVDVKLAAGATITGAVVGGPADPGPLNGACVLAVPANPNDSFQQAWTGAGGRYVINGLAAGTYRVYLADPLCDNGFGLPGLAPQWYRDQPDQPGANLVTVRAGRTTSGVSATLPPLGGIQGRVSARSGAGVFGECVTAVPFRASADPISGLVPAPDISVTQPTGHYRLLGLTPGRYKVRFSTGCGATGFTTQWWHDAASAGSAQAITVRYAIVSGIDVTLRR